MYLDHYHLNAKPFSLSPSPQFLWFGEKHNEAFATLKYGIQEDVGFLLLTGDVGVGKTALIHRLLNHLDSSTIVAHIADPGLETLDFFRLMAVGFNISTDFKSKGEFLIELERFLYRAYSDHKKVLLIIDESQRLNNRLLDQIRVLSNIERSNQKLINIFFVGQPEFTTLLMANGNRAMRQRIVINYHINPLTESETGQYIEHRLKVAGATRKIFMPNAIPEIFRFTEGHPRAINIICDHALVTGFASGLQSIDADVIRECEREINFRAGFDFSRTDFQAPTHTTRPDTFDTIRPDTIPPSPRRRLPFKGYSMLIGICIVLCVFGTYYLLRPVTRGTVKPISQQRQVVSSNEPAVSVEKKQLLLSQKIEKEQARVFSKTETDREKPSVDGSIRIGPSPEDEIAVTDFSPAVFKAKISPVSDGLASINEMENNATEPGESQKDLAPQSVTTVAVPEPQPDQITQKTKIEGVDKLPFREETTTAGREEKLSTSPFNPIPDKVSVKPGVESNVTASGKAQKNSALLSVTTVAVPEPQPDQVVQKAEIKKRPVLPSKSETTTAGRKPEVSIGKTTPATDQVSTKNDLESDVAVSTKTAEKPVLIAALPVAKPSPQLSQGARVKNTPGKSTAAKLKSEPTKESNTVALKSKAESPSPLPTVKESSEKEKIKNQTSLNKNKQIEKESSGDNSQPLVTAKAETQLQFSNEQIGDTELTTPKQPDRNTIEDRLELFLQNYCITYAAKDLDTFTTFFAPGASENGKSFESLLPKYKRNFKFVETIKYRIELQEFSYDDNKENIKVDGKFFLEWLPPNKKWRENTGVITMHLIENGPSFLVQRLDYQSTYSKKKSNPER